MEKVATVLLNEDGEFYGELGGKGFNLTQTGLRAVDIMLISVGYCFGLTVEAYAKHKGYEIKNLKIDVIGKKHEKENRYSQITIKVSFDSNLDDKQIQRVIEIGKRGCTVSNTMLKPPEIKAVFSKE
ncbi:OsmC family protein [Persephonella atlantica]|uniref:OsmC family protein n=1 Tax=Persephonella atlantica TaxID=2699429 RepID=A0ABS1GF32_9AQUI|nr:OsmC family protein [Persephonella atlantica]MBK3331538.1 OsmC family protein [Persephonella atlantica]